MSLDGQYDPENIFAKMLRGDVPCHRVYEDDAVLAFLDLYPQSKGHTLVIPKAPARNLLDAEADTLATLFPRVQNVAKAVRAALNPDGLVITQFNGASGGQTVFHLHVHIIPRYDGQTTAEHGAGLHGDHEALAAIAVDIAAHLKG
ncbi:MAG: HIT family protein [Maricaulaceae bacterium]